MNVNASNSLSTYVWGQRVQTPQVSPLTEDQRILYNQIGNDIIRLHAEQRANNVDSELRVLIFRQSKSWSPAEKLLKRISTTDIVIKKWVNNWISRIKQMKACQITIKTNSIDIAQFTTDLEENRNKDTNTTEVIPLAIAKRNESSAANKQQILNLLREGKLSLLSKEESLDETPGTMEPEIALSKSCQKVIEFLNENWDYLKVFSDSPERVSLNEERLTTKLTRLKKNVEETPFKELTKRSTKAIFLIQSSIVFANGESTVKMGEKYFADEPAKNHSSSTTIINDTYLYNANFAALSDVDLDQLSHKVGAEEKELIVTMAINRANTLLNSIDQSTVNLNSLRFHDNLTELQTESPPAPHLFDRIFYIWNYFTNS